MANSLQDRNVQTQPRSSQADNHCAQALSRQGHIRDLAQVGRQQPGLPAEDLRPGIAVQLVPGAIIDLGDGVTIQVGQA